MNLATFPPPLLHDGAGWQSSERAPQLLHASEVCLDPDQCQEEYEEVAAYAEALLTLWRQGQRGVLRAWAAAEGN